MCAMKTTLDIPDAHYREFKAKTASGHCHEGRDLVDCWKSRSGGMADAADLKSAAR